MPQHWVCFTCRKQFRKPDMMNQRLNTARAGDERVRCCGKCKSEMVDMGRFFKPPRRDDLEYWGNMQLLAEDGIRFASGNMTIFLRILGGKKSNKRSVKQMIAFLVCNSRSEGEILLHKISRKRLKE